MHSKPDITDVAIWLGENLNTSESEIISLLKDRSNAVLGERNLVNRYRTGIQWNPADDLFEQIWISTYEASNTNWIIDGEIYTLDHSSSI
ncbi:hypothetical protein ACTWQB_10030 [Piscibacillus sp. B03]|uniref:hypothetical protein n=1 Tax=Piscibacillus sp. B03 TaxID=3457430 RepID=UPI003FCE2809